MNDFLEACISDIGTKKDYPAFQSTFCNRCRNRECVHAKWAADKFAVRVAVQPDRMLHPQQADPTNPKYAQLTDFVDNLREAMRLEIADRRRDWEVPEIPILDGRDDMANPEVTRVVDNAVRTLAQAKNPDCILPDLESKVPEKPVPPKTNQQTPVPKAPTKPGMGNTPVKDGVMVGGGRKVQSEPEDPWEPKKKIDIVESGAKITLGGKK
jgi:hypothetical protein